MTDRDTDRAGGGTWDVVVVGVGSMGSMALWHLASRGLRVLGVERHQIGHELGAAGGRTRIFRVAYKEGAWYVPLLRRADELWTELSALTDTELLRRTGALTIGPAGHPEVVEVLRSVREFDLPHELLDGPTLAARYPQHRLHDDDLGVFDPQGGLLAPVTAIRTATGLAESLGATVHTGRQAVRIEEAGDHVLVHTTDGVVRAGRVLVCGGPWTGELFGDVRERYEIRRVVLHWFRAADPDLFGPSRFPVGIRRSGPEAGLSFFPAGPDGLVKINLHIPKTPVTDLDEFDRTVPADYTTRVEAAAARLFTGVEPAAARAAAYFEGYTPDNHGLIGRPAGHSRVVSMSGFSGHGFKLAPVLAELGVDVLFDRAAGGPLDHLALARTTGGHA
ncbi:N-methyl-L-tryptophan oxidase [Actinophytocola gossypii]|uniref:N-methyl-L-tryptophan oxidase n=1 Tax=Actinophytocola gossypii TaxID=2812003 RepID=A0ABT2JB11_9PSEU|nr:N-methyl-L-tryptophan oxidase [Actinophytocola gossypii]MCT2584484.1 N-methyl-L-tryptophan oxidase [Actinophytocola gossypii]